MNISHSFSNSITNRLSRTIATNECAINSLIFSRRWNDYKRVGGQILDTRFICFKVPLRQQVMEKCKIADDEMLVMAQVHCVVVVCQPIQLKFLKIAFLLWITLQASSNITEVPNPESGSGHRFDQYDEVLHTGGMHMSHEHQIFAKLIYSQIPYTTNGLPLC